MKKDATSAVKAVFFTAFMVDNTDNSKASHSMKGKGIRI